MNVYIDCGAYDGDTADCKKLFNFKADKTIGYEPNKIYRDKLIKLFDEFYDSAVWTADGASTFYIDHATTPMGSTMMSSKTTGDLRPIECATVDFSKVIEKYKNDTLLVKMDIEGGEFVVLQDLINKNLDQYIDILYVEMHPNKIPEYTSKYSDELIKKLNCGKVELWH